MPSKCGVSTCFVYSTHKEYKLFRIPAVRRRGTPAARQQMILRRSLWATSCGLDDPPLQHILICSRHFVSGKPAEFDDVHDVDWIPTLNLKHDEQPGRSPSGNIGPGGVSSRTETETMTACCVPDCVNQRPEWVTNLPKDKDLKHRWMMAIQTGSGQPVVGSQNEHRGVCNMHFADQLIGSTENGYREPTLFVRDNVLLQVVSCRLCMDFDTVDNMFNMKLNMRDGQSLQWMAKTYFGQFSSPNELAEQGFFCERCTIQIDITHSFWREISDNARKYRLLMAKMTSEKVEFGKNVAVASAKHEQSILPKPCAAMEQPTNDGTEIRMECDPGLHEPSSDEDYVVPEDVCDNQNGAIKSEFTEEEHCLIEPMPPKQDQSKQTLFKCYLCEIRRESKNSLIHHLMMDHKDHESLRCEECNMSFQRITVFNKHLGMHDPSKRLKCSVCPLRFRKTSAKVKHEAARHGMHQKNQQAARKKKTKKNQCSQCDKSFVCISELRRHEKFKHLGGVIARCEICDKTFASVRNLTRHLKLHRNDEKPPSLTTRTATEIRCNLCLVAFEVSKDMVSHLEQVHPEAEFKTYPCLHCETVFFSSTSRANHNNIHSDIYACDLCGKRHYSKRMLQQHRQSKHAIPMDENQFRNCPICERRYIKGTDYLRHMRTHEEEKLSCKACGKKFRERDQLRIHERIHTQEKPMECVACGARFGSPSSLYRHKKICAKTDRN